MSFDPSCPAPSRPDVVLLAHGGGGRATHALLRDVVLPALGLERGAPTLDAALLEVPAGARLAFTTDATVVRPTFFPGGDLGRLCVFGAVNDLACAGALPLALSLSLVLEEGLAMGDLERVLDAVRRAADEAGVRIVTGDTKVVERGRGDGLYTSVSGVGVVTPGLELGPHRVREGDVVLVSGDVGRHGVAILSVREGLAFESTIESDCAPVTKLVTALVDAGASPSCLRDPTRGGLSAVLNEIAIDASLAVEVNEPAIPIERGVRAACELMGLDPLSMACEGRLVAFVPEARADAALSAWRGDGRGRDAARIGRVIAGPPGRVTLVTALGTRRILDFTSGEALPRIC